MRCLILAALISTACILRAAAGDRFTGDLTELQITPSRWRRLRSSLARRTSARVFISLKLRRSR
jgi:hypothetical protein